MPPDSSAGLEPAFRDVLTFNAVAGREFPDRPCVLASYVAAPDTNRFRETAGELHRQAEVLKTTPAAVAGDPAALAMRLITEETAEVLAAAAEGRLDDVADNLVDLIYVALGAAAMFGIDLPRVWDAVHGANMAKLAPCEIGGPGHEKHPSDHTEGDTCSACRGTGLVATLDAGGKVMKPAGWRPPDVALVLAKQPPGALGRYLATPALRPFSLPEATAAVFHADEIRDMPAGDRTVAALFVETIWKGMHQLQLDASGVHTLLLATSEIALAGGVRLHHPFSGVTLGEVRRAIQCLRAAGFLPPESQA